MLVEHQGEWLRADVLWEYDDGGRRRALVRFETRAGLVVRQLRWADELAAAGRVLELDLVLLDPGEDRVGGRDRA